MNIAELHWLYEYPGESFDLTERQIRRTMVHYAWEVVQTIAVLIFCVIVVGIVG